MQDMINRIVEMDQKAQEITTEAQTARMQAEADVKARRSAIREELLSRARARLKINEETERELAEQGWQKVKTRHEEIASRLDADYRKNGEGWVSEIVNRVLGV